MSQSNSWVDRLTPASPDGPSSLAAERAGSNVDVDVLSEHLMGKKYLEQRERIVAILESEKLFSKDQIPNLSRPERYVVALARGKRMRQLQDEHKWSDEEHEIAKMLTDEMSPYQLNNTMFRQTLREQTNDEQRRYWLKQCEEWNIVGAYCQTELGHGSNVQGLETTATWDPKTGDFILHSPHLTSAKWWNGSLGRTANYGVVIAQLRLPDPDSPGGNAKFKSYGPHPFIVQLRDEKNHKPLPGIVVGDIGPKFGYAAMDNGYMLMNQVRYMQPPQPLKLLDTFSSLTNTKDLQGSTRCIAGSLLLCGSKNWGVSCTREQSCRLWISHSCKRSNTVTPSSPFFPTWS